MSGNKIFSLILLLLVVLGAVFAYFYWPDDEMSEIGLYSAAELAGDSGASATSQEFLSILDDLNAIRLDASILNDPNFQALRDFSVTLVPEPRGRENPFAPFGIGNRSGVSRTDASGSSAGSNPTILNSLGNNGSPSGSRLSPNEQSRILNNL